MYDQFSRREFLIAAAAAGVALPAVRPQLLAAEKETKSANDKLNLGVIGVAARGGDNLAGVSSENIVVLCDIDEQRLAAASEKFPSAATCHDFRAVFDHKLDGLVVSTPDHIHAFPVVRALRQGIPVYCEKPLTHSLHEARTIRNILAEKPVVTQMGNQIHSEPNYRRVVEKIQSGVIGPVRRVHVWIGASDAFHDVPSQEPSAANYALWLGPAPDRPFNRNHYHFNWRYWWDFGGGNLSDFWCHYSDLAFWALGLKAPETVHAVGEKGNDRPSETPTLLKVDYKFPARGDQPPVHMTWYQGGWMPEGAEVYKKTSGVLFEGDDGRLFADYGTNQVFMQEGKAARPVTVAIPDSIGHHREWIEAIKTGSKTMSPFEYGAMLTESAHLGNISYRLGGKELTWDHDAMQCVGAPEAASLIQREYRKGWTL